MNLTKNIKVLNQKLGINLLAIDIKRLRWLVLCMQFGLDSIKGHYCARRIFGNFKMHNKYEDTQVLKVLDNTDRLDISCLTSVDNQLSRVSLAVPLLGQKIEV